MNLKINVLGTEYSVEESTEALDSNLVGKDGYVDTSIKHIVIDEMKGTGPNVKKNLPGYKKAVLRHELIHAFLHESGLDVCSWADNEEMVDWIAIQFPKMVKAFMEADCIDMPIPESREAMVSVLEKYTEQLNRAIKQKEADCL